MRCAVLLVLCALAVPSLSYTRNSFQWLSYLRGRRLRQGGYHGYSDAPRPDACPLECDCPSLYPTAMFCHARGLQHVPFVPSHMQYVYLHNNRIGVIAAGVFSNATQLRWLTLHGNVLTSEGLAGGGVFGGMQQLERLYLHGNRLSSVPANLPRSLTELRLNYNSITALPAQALAGMASLTTLWLQGNSIVEVGGALSGLASLVVLDLHGNKLENVPDPLPVSLQQLYLESNYISAVPPGFLSRLPALRFLRLANNRLTDSGIPPQAFNISQSLLVELDLSHNSLETIPPVSMSLENLYLQANQIKEFTLSSLCSEVGVTTFSQLRVLRLDANQISARNLPYEASLCLRLATTFDL